MSAPLPVWRLAAHQRMELDADPTLLAAALDMPGLVQVEGAHAGRVRLRTRGVVGTMVRGPLRVIVSPRHLSRAVALGLVLGGLWMALGWYLAGAVMAITIVGIPA